MSSSSITIRYKKDAIENQHLRNSNYSNRKNTIKRKYFLLCADCFWMASTLLVNSLDIHSDHIRKCPKCNSSIDKFPIPNIYG
jgi:hypothetical protein